ncbi:Conserved hypothetical protein; Pilus biogenesis CpaD-related [Bradyrhizobium sp. ORS 285]|uniref:CpaD family pilus assembly lipoprotein n=1 Tax=Bradyrhizobium sp. ORS 285 TaxID=115808 RepID=UPI0002406146|nr:CpaD family pilus assembly lipoprotein [Bradyrhizobium sp. ORS 285]CCD84245.1 lipoprotein y4xK precursor with unknown function [Bradyrhizobium sp. ORS 285]SMX56489.1 Conserved hypothetical protein; Pilus biogenesis CpaD-related [Bradyrhizobium sp. ORS 285]
MILRQICQLIGVAATLVGCADTAPDHYGPGEQSVKVEQKSRVLFLKSLHRPEAHRLRRFIATAGGGRPDVLHVDVTGSERLTAQVAHEALAMGIAPYNIRLSNLPPDHFTHSMVRIEVTTFQVYPPPCPSLSIVGPTVNDNAFDSTLGCSTRNNLATMVNDPVDLLENRSIMPSNGERAANPLARDGTFRPSSRMNGEDGPRDKLAPEASGATAGDGRPIR